MAWRNVSGLVFMWRCSRSSLLWLSMQTNMVRACRSMPQENGRGVVWNRLRSSPLHVGMSHYQHTTVACCCGWLFQSELEMPADFRWIARRPRAFPQGTTGMGVAGCGHGTLSVSLTHGIL
jgi:hypothetical protein